MYFFTNPQWDPQWHLQVCCRLADPDCLRDVHGEHSQAPGRHPSFAPFFPSQLPLVFDENDCDRHAISSFNSMIILDQLLINYCENFNVYSYWCFSNVHYIWSIIVINMHETLPMCSPWVSNSGSPRLSGSKASSAGCGDSPSALRLISHVATLATTHGYPPLALLRRWGSSTRIQERSHPVGWGEHVGWVWCQIIDQAYRQLAKQKQSHNVPSKLYCVI